MNMNITQETEDVIDQLNIRIHDKCNHFHLSLSQPNSSKLELWLKNKDELVSHVMIGCEYTNCQYQTLHIMTTTEPKYQRQNYNQFLTAVVVILTGTLRDREHNRFIRLADFTTVKARMKVLQKYILHKTSDHDEPMTQEEKEIEIDKPDGIGLFNIYMPLYNDDDNDDSTLVPHSNQQIAHNTIDLLLTDEKHGIMCLQQRGGRKTRKKRKNNKKRKTRRIKTRRIKNNKNKENKKQ